MPVVIEKTPDIQRVRTGMNNVLRRAAMFAGETMQKSVQKRIPPPRGAWSSCCHKATGVMRGDVKFRKPRRTDRGYVVRIGMFGNASRKYQRIHEYGGVIRAKNKPYLTFKINGRWIRVKEVRIRPKFYFQRGWRSGVRRIAESLPANIRMTAKRELPDTVR